MAIAEDTLGATYAQALAAKDFERVAELLAPQLDFRGLTPRRQWEATTREQVVGEILTTWFDDDDHIQQVLSIETSMIGQDCERVTYRFSGENGDGPFVVEQHAVYTAEDGRITWMRVLCSGFHTP
jgi:hypothetical protein